MAVDTPSRGKRYESRMPQPTKALMRLPIENIAHKPFQLLGAKSNDQVIRTSRRSQTSIALV